MKIFSAVLLMIFSTVVFAENKGGLFIEPMLTYENGEGDVNFPDPINNSDTEIDGFGLGARLGFHVLESVFIGADGRYSLPRFKDSSLDQDVKSKAWNYGPVVGVQMPTTIDLRVWGSYIIDGSIDPEKDQDVDEKFSSANGYRIGAEIKLGITSINLEYQKLKYDKTEVDEVGTFPTGFSSGDIELENSSLILSVSFPISL